MALSATIYDNDKKAEENYWIGVDFHADLSDYAKMHNLTLLKRMSDYYKDTTFLSSEIISVLNEIDFLQHQPLHQKFKKTLSELKEIFIMAQKMKRNVSIVAD